MSVILKCVLLFIVLTETSGDMISSDFKLCEVLPVSRKQVEFLQILRSENSGVYFWKGIRSAKNVTQILIPVSAIKMFMKKFRRHGMVLNIMPHGFYMEFRKDISVRDKDFPKHENHDSPKIQFQNDLTGRIHSPTNEAIPQCPERVKLYDRKYNGFPLYIGLFYRLAIVEQFQTMFLTSASNKILCGGGALLRLKEQVVHEGNIANSQLWTFEHRGDKKFVIRCKGHISSIFYLSKSNESSENYFVTLEHRKTLIDPCLSAISNWKCHFKLTFNEDGIEISTGKYKIGLLEYDNSKVLGSSITSLRFLTYSDDIYHVEIPLKYHTGSEQAPAPGGKFFNGIFTQQSLTGESTRPTTIGLSVEASFANTLTIAMNEMKSDSHDVTISYKLDFGFVGEAFKTASASFTGGYGFKENINEGTSHSESATKKHEISATVVVPAGLQIDYTIFLTVQKATDLEFEVTTKVGSKADALCFLNHKPILVRIPLSREIVEHILKKGIIVPNVTSGIFEENFVIVSRKGKITADLSVGMYVETATIEYSSNYSTCKHKDAPTG